MATRKTHGHPVIILGAGRGGSALLEMFLEDDLADVVAIADPDASAPGIRLAKSRGIPTYSDSKEAVIACREYPDCIVYNLTHDDSIVETVGQVFGQKKVTSGPEAKLFWQMVTNLKRVKEELEKSQNQLKAIIHHAIDGIITINEASEIEGFNPAAEKIFGYSQQEVLGRNVNLLMPESFGSREGQDPSAGVGKAGREVVAVRSDGSRFPAELSVSEMTLSGRRYFIGIVRDITERKAAEQKITYLAHHDYLTDLPNRALFLDRLGQAIALAKRHANRVAILFLDLDGFKGVNDRMGHDAGDLLLKGVAGRLNGLVRSSDTVARVGGDEFTLVLNNVVEKADASLVADKIIDALTEPFDLMGERCRIGASIGISLFPDDAGDSVTLLKRADEAMYLAKQKGRNRYKFHMDLSSESSDVPKT